MFPTYITFGEISAQIFRSRHTILTKCFMGYKVLKPSSSLQKIKVFIDFPSSDIIFLVLPMMLTYIIKLQHNYDARREFYLYFLVGMMYFGKFCKKLIYTRYFTIQGNCAPPSANVHKIPIGMGLSKGPITKDVRLTPGGRRVCGIWMFNFIRV